MTIPISGQEGSAPRRRQRETRSGPSGQRRQSQRTLQLETLETRQLLAGDLGIDLQPATGPSDDWVGALYTDSLKRHASDAESQYWSQLIDGGVGRDTVAHAILTSREARGMVVADFYEDYLGRTVDPAGLDFWINIWNATGGPDVVNAALIGSQEFYNAHGGTNQGAIQGLYNELLGRYAAPAEVDYWNGVISRTPLANVALGFIRSDEYRLGLVDQWYEDYLNRPVDAASGQYWVWRMNTGLAQSQVQAALIGSAEYSALSVFDVKDYGAVGDGVTNDAPAIQAAFDAAKAAGGGRVVFGKPAISYLIGTIVLVSDAQNIVVDATEAVFTERTTGGVAILLDSFRFEDGHNVTWRGGRVLGSEVQGKSVTHGGASTGYHAWMAAKIQQNPNGLPPLETPVFLRFLRTRDVAVNDLYVEGRLIGLQFVNAHDATVRGYRFQGLLDGTFRNEVGQDVDDRLAERWVIKTNFGIVIIAGVNFLVDDIATANDDEWFVGSLIITSPSGNLPQNVLVRDFDIGAFQDHALYFSSDYTIAEYGKVRGRELQGGSAIDFRIGSHNAARGVYIRDVNRAVSFGSNRNDGDYIVEDSVFDNVDFNAITALPQGGAKINGIVIRNNLITNHPSSTLPAIWLVDVNQATVENNTIISAPYHQGITIDTTSGVSSGNVIRGNTVIGARRGIFARNVVLSQFVGNVGQALAGGTNVNTVLHLENISSSTFRGNVSKDPGGTAVYVPAGTSWSANSVLENVGLVLINS